MTSEQINTIIETLQPLHPTMIGIFGSYARGDNHADSDIDILMDYEKVPSLFNFIHVQEELSKKLGVKIDLVTKRGLSPYIKPYVDKDLKIIYYAERR